MPSNPDWEGIFCPSSTSPVFGSVWGAPLTPCPASSPLSVTMATVSAWKGERSRVGGALWHLASPKEVLGLCPLGALPRVCAHSGSRVARQCTPWGSRAQDPNPRRLPVPTDLAPNCPPASTSGRAPASEVCCGALPRPTPAGSAHGPAPPAPRPSSLGLGLSQYSQRGAPGGPREGLQPAAEAARGPGP